MGLAHGTWPIGARGAFCALGRFRLAGGSRAAARFGEGPAKSDKRGASRQPRPASSQSRDAIRSTASPQASGGPGQSHGDWGRGFIFGTAARQKRARRAIPEDSLIRLGPKPRPRCGWSTNRVRRSSATAPSCSSRARCRPGDIPDNNHAFGCSARRNTLTSVMPVAVRSSRCHRNSHAKWRSQPTLTCSATFSVVDFSLVNEIPLNIQRHIE